MSNDFQYWRDQLAGKQPETRLPAQPEAGYYRAKRGDAAYKAALKSGEAKGVGWNAIAIWREGDNWLCTKQFGRDPEHHDEICELFASICRNAITYEVYQAVVERGEKWPEEVSERGPAERLQAMYGETEREKALKDAPAEIGHNSGDVAPFEILRERINDATAQLAKYLGEIGGKPTSQEQADKVTNFGILIAEIEKETVAGHKAAKEPWLAGGKKVDAEWKPVIELAGEEKSRIKREILTPYLIEKQRQANEAAEAERKRLREAHDVSDDAPIPTVEPVKVKSGNRDGKGVSLRTQKTVEITDLKAVAAYFASLENPPADFYDVCKKLADKVLKAGVAVPGAHHVSQQVAA